MSDIPTDLPEPTPPAQRCAVYTSLTMKPNVKPISKSKAGKTFPTQTSNDPDSPSSTVADWEGAVRKQGGVVIGHARIKGRAMAMATLEDLQHKPKPTTTKTPISSTAWHQSCEDALKHVDETGLHATLAQVMAWMATWGTDKELPTPLCHP